MGARTNDYLKLTAYLVFLVASYLGSGYITTQFGWLPPILLFPPLYLCGEWASGKVLHEKSILSVSNTPFSVRRILISATLGTALLLILIFSA